jgi:hypothetical protein
MASYQFHPHPKLLSLQPAFDPTSRQIIPLPKIKPFITVDQICCVDNSEPSWTNKVVIVQGDTSFYLSAVFII